MNNIDKIISDLITSIFNTHCFKLDDEIFLKTLALNPNYLKSILILLSESYDKIIRHYARNNVNFPKIELSNYRKETLRRFFMSKSKIVELKQSMLEDDRVF